MAPPVWTLVLLVGAAWGQGHMPAPVRKGKPSEWKPLARNSRDNSVLTQCDFEDNSNPLCDWTQVSTDDGDWTRASGPSPIGSTGPPGGYPNGEGYYLHMASSTFHRGGVARLRSPPVWEQGPLCVHFAYHLFGLSWGAQLKLLLLRGTKKKRPSLLWKHTNTQNPSWIPTTVTVPMGLALPSRVMFEGVRGSTAYLDIALDAISIHRGSCNRICMMQMCSFDIPNDLCGWSWIPTASGAKWVQKKGSSGVLKVGPEDDFSSPGGGFYMLLDPKNAKPRQKSVLLSPLSQSSGCLSLSFHYILYGQSPGAALAIYASVLGSIRKHTLFSGQPGPNWQPVTVNYTAQGQIQFTVVGVFGETPEPAVAVDAISIAPCGESFPQCDFDDDAHPFCDWAQASEDGGHWTRGSKNMHIQGTGAFGGSLNGEGRYIYFEADKFSEAGQSCRLVSRPFCAPSAICVEFAYHMYGLGEGAKLSLLLESPAGSFPTSLWHRVGSQSPDWLNTSVTIPSGHQQPMQLILEAIRGTNTAFVVAVGFILINHGTCRGTMPTVLPSKSPVPPTGPSETLVSTEKPRTPTEKPTVPKEKPMATTEKPTVPSEISTVLTEKPMALTGKPMTPTEKPMTPQIKPMALTEKPTVTTVKPIVPTEKPTIPTKKPTVPSEETIVPSEETTVLPKEPTISTGKPTIPTGKPTIPTKKSTIPPEKPSISTEEPIVHTERPTVHTERTTIHTERSTVPIEKPTMPTERPTIPTEKSTLPTEKPTVLTERPTIPTEKPTLPTEKPTTPTEKTTIPTEKSTLPKEKPTIPTERPTVPTEKPTVPTESSTIHTEKPTLPTEKPTVLTERPTIPTEKPTTPTEKTTIPTEKPTLPKEKPTVPTESSTIPTEKPTLPTEKPTIHTEKPTLPTEKPTVLTERPTIPTEKPTTPTEKTTIPTEKPTVPKEKPTVPTERPTIPTEKSTLPTEKPTIHTEKPTLPTEKPTVPTERPTIPTEKSTLPTEKPTIHTEKPTLPTEKPTVPTERPTIPTEKSTLPTEKPTIPTEKPTLTTENPPVPTERPTIPTEKPTVPTERPTIPTEKPTLPTEKPTTPTEKTTIPTEKPTLPKEKPTVPTERPTVPTEKPTVSIERPTIPTEKPTLPTEKPTVLTERPTIPTEKPTTPTEKTTIPTEKPTLPTEKPTILTERPTIPTEKPTTPTEKTTIPTEKPTLPTEKPTIPTERSTVPTEKPPVPTERPTTPTEKTTIPTEKSTVLTEKTTVPTGRPTIPTEKTTIPTEKPTVPTKNPTIPTKISTFATEWHTVPTIPQPSPTLVPIGPTVLVMPSTAPSTSTTATTPGRTPARCPPNAHYERCTCPASCERPKPNCGPPCKPGCVCNSGFLFRGSLCINASSCNCFYNNNYYKPGAEWFSSNCTERCRCRPGSRMECQISQCGTHTVCQLKNGHYGCQPYGTATCTVYGDPHYLTFDGRHFNFMGKCTYVLAQPCGNSTEPFFRVAAKNENRGQEGMSCLSKVYVTLHEITITLLRDRRTLVGGKQVSLPAVPSKGIFLASSGRFVELQTAFGLRVRWDGNQQLYISVPSTYSSKLCGFCGNYDGDGSNDNQKPDGSPALDDEELGNSWQTAEDEDKECQKNPTVPPSCKSGLQNSLSGLQFCGRLLDTRGAFEACLPHLKASSFFKSCTFDMCKFQGLQPVLCAHMAALTEICQDAGYAVKPWRGPQFCPMTCPPNSTYTLCARVCPATCHSGFSGMACQNRCVEGCECNPGFVLSGLQCVPHSQCGCLEPTLGYFKVGERWFKPGCRQLCTCESNNKIRCTQWRCQAQEVCRQQDGIYGCHALGAATCTVSGDPHYLTFDGALHHFMGTCSYILTRPCQSRSLENYFIVSATNEFRSGNLEASYVRSVHLHIFNLRISLIKGHKVMLNGRRVALPVWPAQGRVSIRPSGSFILLYTDFGLQIRYDGKHLAEVTVPSSYAGRLCGLCGNYNNNSLDDNLLLDKRPVASSDGLGVAWKFPDYSETGCFAKSPKPSRCQENRGANSWEKNCDVLMDPQGPFSQCHGVVPPQSSFASCVYGQCGTKGDTLTLCRSLQAYASLCAHAGRAPSWRNGTFCPLKCPSSSSYSPCANPCPATCLSLTAPRDCPAALPCTEGCECQKGHILSGTSCVPLSQCGCVDQEGYYHPVGERWYADHTCSRLCTCSTRNAISCQQAACKPGQMCWPLDGLLRCRASGMGVCRISNQSQYLSFDGTYHTIRDTCTGILVKVCHPTMDLPFFKISVKYGKKRGQSAVSYLHQVNVDFFNTLITLIKDHRVLINGTQVTFPFATEIRGLRISIVGNNTVLYFNTGVQVKFDGKDFFEVQLPAAYYQKVCGLCGNFNGEEEDELMMPNDELAQNDTEFVESWQDKESHPNCQKESQETQAIQLENLNIGCRRDDLVRAQEQCQAAFQTPAWTECATYVFLKPFLLKCIHNLCQFGGLRHALCGSLENFAAACRARGLQPPIWRNSSFCPLECPIHTQYSSCVPSCLPSCVDPSGQCSDTQVPTICKEGCICQSGFVLSGKECVPRSQCGGCTDDYGSSFPEGKTWITIRCTRRCACTLGTVHCQQFSCPSGSHCEPQSDGTGTCDVNTSEQCSVYGDPHYRTFDGLSYLFRGRMTYTLIKTVDALPTGVAPLIVEGRNKVYLPWSPVYLHEIIVVIYGYTVQLRAQLELVVNNQKVDIPYQPDDRLRVNLRGHRLFLITDFEMLVSFDGGKNAVITLPNKYKGLVRGLCGNFDGNKRNDFVLPNGTITQDLIGFGNSWEVHRISGGLARFARALPEEEEEEGEESGSNTSECTPERLALINSTQACRVLVDPQGPFAACHQTVAPEPFQEHCVFDLCTARTPKEQEELRCQVLSGYAIICQEAGATPAGWRDLTGCALACPANTVYQSCMTPCPASCANLAAPRDCKGPCVEGCASLPGYIYSGARSLPVAHCGCTSNGIYYQRGDSFVTEDCSQRCTCASSGVLLCEPLRCRAGEICTLGNLTRGCFRESPCLRNPCQNDGRCQEQGTHFTCECELGYGGHLCTEPQDAPPPGEPEASSFVAILLGMLVPVVVIVPAVTWECVSRKRRRREKTQSQNREQAGRCW